MVIGWGSSLLNRRTMSQKVKKVAKTPQFFVFIDHKFIYANPQESGRTKCNNFLLCFLDNIVVNLIYLCTCWQIVMTQTEVVEKVRETKQIFSYRE